LRALDCTNAQGYYFSRPVGAMAAGALIADWNRAAVTNRRESDGASV